MLDDQVRAVLARLEEEDADERARGLPGAVRSRQVARTTGQFLFSFVAPQTACEVLEVGASRGYSTIWLAAGDVFDVAFLDVEKDDYEALFPLARGKLEPGAVIIADNVLSHADALGAYSAARQSDPTLESVTLPLDRGLELSVVLR